MALTFLAVYNIITLL